MTGGDEGIFYNGARLFAATGKAIANHCVAEDVSLIGGYNWYGPFWNVFYGIGYKLFNSAVGMLILNLICSLATLFVIVRYIPKHGYLLGTLLICTYPFLHHQFSLYPEAPMLLMASINLVILVRIVEYDQKKLIPLFFLLILLEIPMRITSVFWLFGLLPSTNGKNKFSRIASILFGFILAFAYSKYFCAPPYAKGFRNLFDSMHNNIFESIYKFIWNFGSNILTIFREHDFNVLVITFSSLFIGLISIAKKNRNLSAYSFILIGSIAIILFFYTTISVFYIKQTAFLWLIVLFITIKLIKINRFKLVTFFIIVLPFQIYASVTNILAHNTSPKSNSDKGLINSLQKISNLNSKNDIITVLYHVPDMKRLKNFHAFLPMVNMNGKPIRYSTNICYPYCDPDKKYTTYGKILIDFILVSVQDSAVNNVGELYHADENFLFYTNN